MNKFPVLALALALSLSSGIARAESDWFASLYTGEGTELRADERVFTLFALLNAMGYDHAPVSRQFPLPKHQFHPVREQVRQKLAATDPAVKKQIDAFFDGHAVPIERYLAYTVTSSAPPFESGSKSKDLADLKGLEQLLKTVHQQWNLADLMASVQGEYRKGLKGYLTAVDAPIAKAKKALKVPDAQGSTLLVMNLLEAHNTVRGVQGEGEVVLVVGPSDKPDVDGILREYARAVLEPKIGKKAASWAGGAAILRDAQALGAKEQTVADYSMALFTRALALRASDAPDSAYDAAAQQGYFGLKDVARMFDDPRPADVWAMDALAKVETRRPAKK